MMEVVLQVNKLCKHFGGLRALDNVDLEVMPGKIHSIVGPNGSGKTTLFNALTRFTQPTSGVVKFMGKDLAGLKPSEVTSLGMARTFQNVLVFNQMTVLENIMVGRHPRLKARTLNAFIKPGWVRDEYDNNVEKCRELMDFCDLSPFENELAGNLPYADQKRLEIARALATEPKLMLLDEPAAGTPQGEVGALLELISSIRDLGITIMLIEHKMDMVMSMSDVISVLNFGKKIAQGTPEEIRRDRMVTEAYLGRQWQDA
jgi:branched-chain amino acid transport system ATP-binding protein